MITLAVDPGRCTGFALFSVSDLTWCCAEAPETALSYLKGSSAIDRIVIEIPQVYRLEHSKGDPGDLIELAFCAGMVVGRIRPTTLQKVLPREWKGQLPKRVTEHRARAVLTVSEMARVPKVPKGLAHNLWDAIALGLWSLGRLKLT